MHSACKMRKRQHDVEKEHSFVQCCGKTYGVVAQQHDLIWSRDFVDS